MLKSNNEILKRFDILDGFRGILAITVVFQHTDQHFQFGGEYKLIKYLGYSFAVPSFFALSSFLLTYKLYSQLILSNGSFNSVKEIILKYLIRRFFRIYIPYFIYCSFIKAGFSKVETYPGYEFSTWYNLVTLKNTGKNHLWTVPPEAKFYLFIPIFSFVSYKLKRYFIIWVSSIILLMYLIEVYNVYDLKCIQIRHPQGENLQLVFQIFLTGSLVGVIYYEIQNFSFEFKILKKLRFLLAYISPIIFIFGLRSGSLFYSKKEYYCYITYGIYWAIYILVLLLDVRSCFNDIINLSIFKKFGKYSFGIYLLHHEGFWIINYLIRQKLIRRVDLVILFDEFFISFILGIVFYFCIENPLMKCANLLIKNIFHSNYVKIITQFILTTYIILIFFFMFRIYLNELYFTK